MKKFLLPVLCLMLCSIMVKAEEELTYYNTCENAIYVDSTFTMQIAPWTVYYFKANTYDLPVTVYFYADSISEEEPEVYVDFSCEMGVYSDPNVANLVENAVHYDVHFPMMPELSYFEYVKNEETGEVGIGYKLSYERDLLDIMAAYGVDYSVPVYVTLFSPLPGTARIDNKLMTTNCEELSITWDRLDTIHLVAYDSVTSYRIPMHDWYVQGNGISVYWSGKTAPTAYLMKEDCVLDTINMYGKWTFANISDDGYYVQDISPTLMDTYQRDNYKQMYIQFLTKENGSVWVDDYKQHNLTIAKCTLPMKSSPITFPSAEAGDTIPMTGDGVTSSTKSYRIKADSLKDKNICLKWRAKDHRAAGAYFGRFCGFGLDITDADVVDTLTFKYNATDDMMYAYMEKDRVNRMVEKCTNDGWLFLQIARNEPGRFWWNEYTPLVLDCDQKGILVHPDTTIKMGARNQETIYKINQADFLDGYAHSFKWEGAKQTYFFITDTCSYNYTPTNSHIIAGTPKTIAGNKTITFTAEQLQTLFTTHADEYDNLYIRMRSASEGKLRTTTIIPETPTGTLSATHGDRTTRLILRDNSIFIEVTDGTTTTLYDLTGRQVQ